MADRVTQSIQTSLFAGTPNARVTQALETTLFSNFTTTRVTQCLQTVLFSTAQRIAPRVNVSTSFNTG